MENDQDKDPIIQAVENAISNCKPDKITIRPPDRHKKKITAELTLNHPDRPIKIRIIAGYMQWCVIWKTFEKADYISFEEIEPFIFRLPKDDREALRAAWDENMSWRIYHAAEATHYKNPLATPPGESKKHPGKKYGTADIRFYARHVYIFLKYWLGRPVSEWPPELTNFFKFNKLSAREEKSNPERLTIQIVEMHLKIDIGNRDESYDINDMGDEDKHQRALDFLFRRYINFGKGLIRLRESYDKAGYLPNRYPLNKIFPPLKS